MPTVSIVIPAYNVAPYIGETLDSVFAQTFADYEVIVINDGSPDTEELERAIQPYQERIRYLSQKNSGASAARNAGLRIDHLLLSPSVAKCLVAAGVDRAVRSWEKSSDHAPVWIEVKDKRSRR